MTEGRIPVPASVSVTGLQCRFGRRVVVDDVHLDVAPGEKVALTGANGSGKSTLLRAVLGLHPTASGHTAVAGSRASSARDWRRRRAAVAWMPQRLTVGRFPVQVHEILASSGDLAAATERAAQLGVAELAPRPLHSLSGGQLQRVFLARALGAVDAGAGVLLADEPTAALDFAGQETVAGYLADLPATVLVVTHDRAVSARCDRVVEMAAGSLREVT